MSIVIVEGPDGSGKTTLLRNLRAQSERYFWIMSSSRRPKTVEELNDAAGYIGQAAYLKLPIVCDRFPLISEAVYGPVMRGSSLLDKMSRKDQSYYTSLISEEVDRIIYCRPNLQVIEANLPHNPQMEGVNKKIKDIVLRYDAFMDSLRDEVKIYRYDYVSMARHPLDELFFGKIRR